MDWHPIACIFPMLSDEKLSELADDIRQHGLREPVVMFEGKVLDGRNRWQACTLAGVKAKTKEFTGSVSEAVEFVWSTNVHRRHLDSGQVAIAVAKREKLDAEFAAAVDAIREAAPKGGRPSKEKPSQKIDEVLANDRKTDHKLAQQAGTNRTYVAKARKLLDESPELAEKVERGEIKLDKAAKQVKQQQKIKQDLEASEKAKAVIEKADPLGVFHGDSFQLARSIPDESCALVFTDPPYDRASLSMFSELGMLASKILVDGGSLITFCGQYLLREVIDLVSPDWSTDDIERGLTETGWMNDDGEPVWNDMRFFWINCCYHTGGTAQMREYGIKVKWKPMIWFVKGEFRRDRNTWVDDLIVSQQEKDSHPWQQSVIEAKHYIERLTLPGELVVDPFCGGGTTAVAAKQLGRNWWTADKEARHVQTARERLS